jgi:hypothetical protein
VTAYKAAMNAHQSTNHHNPPQTKKRKLNLVKCDRCRSDKQNVCNFPMDKLTMANIYCSALPQIELGQQNAIAACKRAFLAQKQRESNGTASIHSDRYRHPMSLEETMTKKKTSKQLWITGVYSNFILSHVVAVVALWQVPDW